MSTKSIKLLMVILLTIGASLTASSQTAKQDPNTGKWGVAHNNMWVVSPEWDEIGPAVTGKRYNFGDTYPVVEVTYPVKKNGLWGFTDSKGKIKTKPKYQAIGTPSSWKEISTVGDYELPRMAIPVQLNGKWGFVGQNGKERIKPIYDYVGDFYTVRYTNTLDETKYKGNVLVQEGEYIKVIKHDGKQDSDITYRNPIVIGEYLIAQTPVGNMVCVNDENIKFSDLEDFIVLTRTNGNIYYEKKTKQSYTETDNGILCSRDNKYGIVCNGKMVTAPIYTEIIKINQAPSSYYVKQDNKWGVLDITKGMLIEPAYDSMEFDGNNYKVRADGKTGMISASGNPIIEVKYDNITTYKSPDQYYVCLNGKWGILDTVNGMRIAPEYDNMNSYGENFIVKKDGKTGIISNTGSVIMDIKYKSISSYHAYCSFATDNNVPNNNIVVQDQDGTYSIYSKTKNAITLSGIQEFGEELYSNGVKVKKNGKWGLLSKNAELILPCQYTDIEKRDSDSDLVYIYNNGIGLAKTKQCNSAKVVVPIGHFDSFKTAYESHYVVGTKGNKIGIYAKGNQTLTPLTIGDDYFTYGDKIYVGSKTTISCYNKNGKLLGTHKGKAGLDAFLRQTMSK